MRAGRLELGGEGSDLTLELAGLELVPGAGEPPFLGGGEDPSVDGPMLSTSTSVSLSKRR